MAGLDDREQKEEFHFYDIDSLRWFMMDSLYSTLTANLGEVEVYYTMDGGQDLAFDELYPVNVFPADTPYLGSPFYFAHAGGQGEMDEVDYRLSELMAESETQNFTRAGTMFCLTTKTHASAVAGRKEELFSALRAGGFGDLVYETVNASSLSAFVKEQVAENGDMLPDWLDGLVNVFEKTTVGVRKAAK